MFRSRFRILACATATRNLGCGFGTENGRKRYNLQDGSVSEESACQPRKHWIKSLRPSVQHPLRDRVFVDLPSALVQSC